MNLDNYSNSHKSKSSIDQEMLSRKKNDKVISGRASVKKTSMAKKAFGKFFAEDVDSIGGYVFDDLVIPYVQKLIIGTIEMMFYGHSRGERKNGYTQYNKPVSSSRGNQNYQVPNSSRPARPSESSHDYDSIVIETRGDAELVLDQMREHLERYKKVSVADMYDFVGLDCTFADYKYGWTNLDRAYIYRVHDGWSIKLDRADVLE